MQKLNKLLIIPFLIAAFVTVAFTTFAESESPGCVIKGPRCGVIKSLMGSVTVIKGDTGESLKARKGMTLKQKDTIKVAGASNAVISIPTETGESVVSIKAGTELSIKELAKSKITGREKTILDLALGSITIRAAELKNESIFEVETPTSAVGVRGTEFEVTVSAPE